jgi:cytochrome c oxidase cbb3-type subunit 3/ubiquinol-cytochrome c reductase cytochrome c subunit
MEPLPTTSAAVPTAADAVWRRRRNDRARARRRQGAVACAAFVWALAIGCRPAESKAPPAPPTLSPEAIRGGELYAKMCAVCHGPAGEGYAADQAPRLAQPDFLASVSDDYLREAIANGRRNTTMSAWARLKGGPLKPEDIDAVVLFIRGWQQRPSQRLDEKPLQGDAQKGAEVFAAQCAKCHGERGVGGPQLQVAGAELLGSASNGFLRTATQHGRPGTPMPAFAATLSPQQIDDVIAALRTFQPSNPVGHEAVGPPPLPLGPVPLNPKGPEPEGFKTYSDMTPADVIHAQLERGARFAILDARAPSDYLHEHITGAVSVPFYDPAPYFSALPKDTWLVCYCGCPHAESGQLAQKLRDQGFKKVAVLDEGLGVWKLRGYPVTTAPAGAAGTP